MQISPLLLLQQRFSKFIQSGAANPADIAAIGILNQPPISVQQRYDIYQNAYSQRIRESFEEDFPKIREILDEDLFSHLVHEYLQKYPSNYWNLGEVGKNLSQFIAQSSWGIHYEYLANLAQFEWFKVLANFALIPEPFNFSTIANIEEDKQQEIILKLDTSVYLFSSRWALHAENIVHEENYYVVYQKEGEVFHTVLSLLQWDILTKISQQFSIGKIIASMPDVQESEVTNFFSYLVSENIITHFTI